MDDFKTIIVDVSSVCYKIYYSMPKLSINDVPTTIIFGFLKFMRDIGYVYKTNDFIYCFDSSYNKRKDIYPNYKNRDSVEKLEIKKEINKQINHLGYILWNLGYRNIYKTEGYESDDLIAIITQTYDIQSYIIVTEDKDLYQLLTSNVSIYKPRKNILYTLKDFKKDYKINPPEWVLVKAIAGCVSDTVKGIVGVGEKTAIKYILKQLKPESNILKTIESNEKLINFNKQLVELPFKECPLPKIKQNVLSISNFVDIINKYKLISFKEENEKYLWIDFFNGNFKELEFKPKKRRKRNGKHK